MFFAIVGVVFLCLLLILEWAWNRRCLRSFAAIVHVNGIRGKSGTCRLIDAALRQKYRVFTKTTGTDARTIGVDSVDRPLRRLGPAQISEQMRIIRRARREGAQVLVIECMAVQPALQRVCQRDIVRAGLCVITNVRLDHPMEMGWTLPEVAESLSNTIPEHGVLFTADEPFYPLFAEKCRALGSRCVLCPEGPPGRENEPVARAVARELGLTDAEIDEGFRSVQTDFGARHEYRLDGVRVLNLFSCNDPDSALKQMGDAGDPVFVYNHRWDRPDRAQLFAERFFPKYPGARVLLLGGSPLVRRLFLRAEPTLRIEPVKGFRQAIERAKGGTLVGLGNTKGEAHRMIEYLEAKGA